MDKDCRFKVNQPSVVYENFDDELVLINLDSGNYYSFEDVGAYIWERIQECSSYAEIVDGISRQYLGDAATMENAVKQFIDELLEEGLIVTNGVAPTISRKISDNSHAIEAEKQKKDFALPVLNKFTNMQDFLLVDPIHEIDYSDYPKKQK